MCVLLPDFLRWPNGPDKLFLDGQPILNSNYPIGKGLKIETVIPDWVLSILEIVLWNSIYH